MYAKASEASARENFTTEALAGAIRVDPEPIVAVLRSKGLLPAEDISAVEVDTQIAVQGGYLDLVLSLLAGDDRLQLWGELKVDAGESGNQLDVYRQLIEQIPNPIRPRLFTLGPKALRDDPAIPLVTWHELRRQVLTSGSTPAWLDFAEYLSEIKMSDDFDQPVSAHEAGSMADFALLLGKTGRILEATTALARLRWPRIGWAPDRTTILRELTRRIWEHRDLLVLAEPRGKPRTVYVAMVWRSATAKLLPAST